MLAGIILGLVSLEGLPKPGMSGSQIISQALAAQAGFALLVQALLDQQKEQAVQVKKLAAVCCSLPFLVPVLAVLNNRRSSTRGQKCFTRYFCFFGPPVVQASHSIIRIAAYKYAL